MAQTPGAKMQYLIRRRPGTSREELVAHWFKNHMPDVIAGQQRQRDKGRLHATRYIATLYDADGSGNHPWDGVAQLWWDKVLPRPDEAHGTEPRDTFQQKAEPYVPWATTEHVFIDGDLPLEPCTLNDPFPTTRSGFFKVTVMAGLRDGADTAAFYEQLLTVHSPEAVETLMAAGALRYAVSVSIEPDLEPYAGMAEMWFPTAAAWANYRERRADHVDDLAPWVDPERTLMLTSSTEMVGIP